MSFSGFKTLFDGQSSRLDRVRVLASPTDIQTGIIDYVTVCNKAYFENVGPTSTTGTALAAIIDLYDVLQGRVTDQLLNVLGMLKISGSAVSIGGDAESGKVLTVVGDALIDGALGATGTASLLTTTVDGDLTVVSGNSFVNEDGTFKVKEANISAIIGQQRNLMVVDQYSNLMVDLYTGSRTVHPLGHAANFGLKYGAFVPFYVAEGGGVFSGTGFSLDEIPQSLSRGFHAAGYGGVWPRLSFYSPAFGQTGGAHSGGFLIESIADWVPGSNTGDTALGASIMHSYTDGGTNALAFLIGGDSTLILEKDTATISGGTGYAIDFTVRSFYGEPNEFFVRLHPSYACSTLRGIGSPVAPALQIGGCHSGKTLRLGFDAWHPENIARLFMDTQTTSGSVPAIAFGKPLGTYTDPCDNLIVSDSPWMVAINANVKTLATSHGDKQGLFIGRGLAGTSDHKAGMLWLEDAVGYAAAIHFGTASEHSYAFMKNGVLKVHNSIDDSHTLTDGLGTTHIGAHKVPSFTTDSNTTTELADIVDQITSLGASEEVDGAVVVATSRTDGAMVIMVYSQENAGWHSFRSTTVTA